MMSIMDEMTEEQKDYVDHLIAFGLIANLETRGLINAQCVRAIKMDLIKKYQKKFPGIIEQIGNVGCLDEALDKMS